MTLDTRPNLDNDKFEQYSDDELSLSGKTKIYGILNTQSGGTININSGSTFNVESGSSANVKSFFNIESGATFNVQKGPILEDNVLTSDASGNTTWAEPNKIIPVGLEGEAIFYEENNTKNFTHGYTLEYATVVENDAELEVATGITPSFETIFNEWQRFSHYYPSDGYVYSDTSNYTPYYPYKINPMGLADPPTYEEQTPNYPGLDPDNPNNPLTQSGWDAGIAWGYDDVNDRIFLTENYNPVTGFISNDEYDRYTARVTMNSPDDDDDTMGIVIAFVTDEETGFEYTLSVIRNYTANPNNGTEYGIIYNYVQNRPYFNSYNPDFEEEAEDIIVDGESLVTTSGSDWNIAGQTIMEVIRDRDIITVAVSQQGGTSIDNGTTLQVDLRNLPKLQKFRGPTQMGFLARSQKDAYFSDLQLSILGNYIFYVKNDGLSHDTYEFDNDTSSWFLQDPQTVTLQDYIGIGRFVYSNMFEKTYYTNSDGSIIQPMTGGGGGVLTSADGVRKEITQSSHGFSIGDFIGWSGGTYNKAIADGTYDGEFVGLVNAVLDSNSFYVTQAGYVSGLTGLVTNNTYFLSPSSAGTITDTPPITNGQIRKPALVATSSNSGWVLPYPGVIITSGDSVPSAESAATVRKEITQTSHGFSAGDFIGWSGGTYNKAIADGVYDGEFVGFVSSVVNTDKFYLAQSGFITGLTGLVTDTTYYLSPLSAGTITDIEPTTNGQVKKPVLIATSSDSGWILPYPGLVVTSGETSESNVSSYTITGDDSTTGFTINHSKETRDVIVQVVEAQSPYSTVLTNVERPDINNIFVTFTTAPAVGEDYKVLIIG